MTKIDKLLLDRKKLDAEIAIERKKIDSETLERNMEHIGEHFSNGNSILIKIVDCYFGSANKFTSGGVYFKALVIDLNKNSDDIVYYDEFGVHCIAENGSYYLISKSKFTNSLMSIVNNLLRDEE